MFGSYQAVSIRHATRCCQAASDADEQRFLSTEAPTLPLTECSAPGQCRCKYRYHTDRREDYRRDTDFGLPERGFFGGNRRNLTGRRTSDPV